MGIFGLTVRTGSLGAKLMNKTPGIKEGNTGGVGGS